MTAIAKKELRSYFSSPIGYVCVSVLLALYGYYYYQVMRIGSSANIPAVYGMLFSYSMLVIPIITMRTFSEDRKNKTDQAYLTAPVGVFGIVFGKFLAALTVFAIVMVLSLVPALFLSFYCDPNWALVLGNVLASLLYGAAMIAIGVFLSSLTESQVVAAVATFGVSIFLMVIDQITSLANSPVVTKVVSWISFTSRYQSFSNGILDVASLVFFISVVAIFLFMTARKLESRRWN